MTQARQCSLEESMILTNVSFSPVYFCPKTPVLNWKETQACDCKILNHPSGCVCGPWPAKQAVGKHVSLYQSQKRLLFFRGTWKISSSSRGNLSPQRKVKSLNSKNICLSEKIQGFWQATHMTTCLTCIGLPALNLIHKPKVGGQQPPKISKET